MNLLIVLSHPEAASFCAAIAREIAEGFDRRNEHRVEIADLANEGFDPRMRREDLMAYRGEAAPPEDVRREQQRFDRADVLVFVFPVYWWSLPALLKGWIDRVFSNGWAYSTGADRKVHGRLRDRPVYLVATGASDQGGYLRHGYREAIDTQIRRGIFGFSGLSDVHTHLLLDAESPDGDVRALHLDTVREIGRVAALSLATP